MTPLGGNLQALAFYCQLQATALRRRKHSGENTVGYVGMTLCCRSWMDGLVVNPKEALIMTVDRWVTGNWFSRFSCGMRCVMRFG